METNCRPHAQIAVYRNIFSIILSTNVKDIPPNTAKITFAMVQQWIETNHGVKVSKSSISQVKQKCGIEKLEYGMKMNVYPCLNTDKEKLVLDAFRNYGNVDKKNE